MTTKQHPILIHAPKTETLNDSYKAFENLADDLVNSQTSGPLQMKLDDAGSFHTSGTRISKPDRTEPQNKMALGVTSFYPKKSRLKNSPPWHVYMLRRRIILYELSKFNPY